MGRKSTPRKTCDFCGSFLHLWKECRDRKEHDKTRKFETYANAEEEEDDHEQGEDEAYAHYKDDKISESDAFNTHHLADLGLIKSSNLPQSGSNKKSS